MLALGHIQLVALLPVPQWACFADEGCLQSMHVHQSLTVGSQQATPTQLKPCIVSSVFVSCAGREWPWESSGSVLGRHQICTLAGRSATHIPKGRRHCYSHRLLSRGWVQSWLWKLCWKDPPGNCNVSKAMWLWQMACCALVIADDPARPWKNCKS